MSRPARLILAAILILCVPLAAAGDEGFYPIKADDGTTIANHRVPVELESQIEKLPGVVIVGNPRGKVTLHEFYDLIPSPIDQNPCAHWRNPMDMMRQGWSTSLFQASQQWSTRSS